MHQATLRTPSRLLVIDTQRTVLSRNISSEGAACFGLSFPPFPEARGKACFIRFAGCVGLEREPLYIFCSLCPQQPFGETTRPFCGATTGNSAFTIGPLLPLQAPSLPNVFVVSVLRQDRVPFTSAPSLTLFFEIYAE